MGNLGGNDCPHCRRGDLGVSSNPAHPFAGFGANEWLVDEMFQQFLKDPGTVDKAWWDFFADYSRRHTNGTTEAAPPSAPVAAPTNAAPTNAAPANGLAASGAAPNGSATNGS